MRVRKLGKVSKTDILKRKDGKCFVRDCTLYARTYITCWECTTPGDIIGTTESFVTGIRNLRRWMQIETK